MDLSRNQRGMSEQIIGGIQLVFDEINKAGGVKNKRLSILVLDDEYDPKKTLERVRLLIDHQN